MATRVPGKWSRRNPSIPKVMLVVLVERVIALLPMVRFAHRQQILAVITQHAPSKMALLSIPKIVLAARVIARLPLGCFARRQQILAGSHHAPLIMVLLSIPKVVLAE